MGNDNKARRGVIISRLPNRLEPKTTASAKIYPQRCTEHKGITLQNWNHQWPSVTLDGAVAIGSPVVIRALSSHLLRTNPFTKTWKLSQSLRLQEFEDGSKTKPQTIHHLTASFSTFFGSLKKTKIREWSLQAEWQPRWTATCRSHQQTHKPKPAAKMSWLER